MTSQADKSMSALNKVAKWRRLFSGWQLGTRLKSDPESNAVSDHREATILLRVELNAMVAILFEKRIISVAEWAHHLEIEAEQLCADYEQRFPGVKANEHGLSMDPQKVAAWMKEQNWKP